jgi:hypothetical protein
MENPVDRILKDKGPNGLSLKQLSRFLGVDRKRVQYHIYNSVHTKDTDPHIHGSGKSKIRVFNYTPEEKGYFDRKIKSKRIVHSETESSV